MRAILDDPLVPKRIDEMEDWPYMYIYPEPDSESELGINGDYWKMKGRVFEGDDTEYGSRFPGICRRRA